MKIVDITEKLTFDGNPKLRIKDKELEVNSDAPTMLKVMSLMENNPGPNEIIRAYELMFTEKARKDVEELKLNFSSLIIVIQEAVTLIAGDMNGLGEQQPVL